MKCNHLDGKKAHPTYNTTHQLGSEPCTQNNSPIQDTETKELLNHSFGALRRLTQTNSTAKVQSKPIKLIRAHCANIILPTLMLREFTCLGNCTLIIT